MNSKNTEEIIRKEGTEKRLKQKIHRQKNQIKQLRSITIVMGVLSLICIVGSIISISNYGKTKLQLETVKSDYTDLLKDKENLQERYNELYQKYVTIFEDTLDYETQITALTEMVTALDEQSKALAISNEEYYNKIQEYESREELLDKYEYCITREDGSRTDITYDQLINVEKLSKEKGIDTDLIMSIVMVESSGKEKASSSSGSTARGYGQFLKGTGEYVYEDIMENGTYDHSMAYDGDTNLTMMVHYLDHLTDINDGDLYASLRNYRGKGGEVLNNYINKIDGYLGTKGKSVSMLNK